MTVIKEVFAFILPSANVLTQTKSISSQESYTASLLTRLLTLHKKYRLVEFSSLLNGKSYCLNLMLTFSEEPESF